MDSGYLYDVYITNIGDNSVAKIRNSALSSTKVQVGTNPYGICVDLTDAVWITDIKSDTVSKISGGIRTDIALTTGSNPYGICAAKDSVTVWVTNSGLDSVTPIVNGIKQDDIAVGVSPRGICIDTNGVVWVANYGSNTVSKIVNGVRMEPDILVGFNPHGICVDSNDIVWVTNQKSNTVSKILNGARVKDIAVGKSPRGICVDMSNAVWVTNSSSNSVSKIVNDAKKLEDVTVGIGPCGISVDKENVLSVVNIVSCSISRIVNGSKLVDISINGIPISFGDATGMQIYLIADPTGFTDVSKISFDDLDYDLQSKLTIIAANSAIASEVMFDDGTTLQEKFDDKVLVAATTLPYANTAYPTVAAALDKLLYAYPAITTFTNTVMEAELGSVVNNVTLNWGLNKVVTTQNIDQGIGDITIGTLTKVLTGLNLTAAKAWNLTVGDGVNTATGSTSIIFCSKVYWGTSALDTLNDYNILNLNGVLSVDRTQSRVFDATGGKYIYFAIPTYLGCDATKFSIGGMVNSDWQITTRTVVNASGYSTSYDIFRSTNKMTAAAISVNVI